MERPPIFNKELVSEQETAPGEAARRSRGLISSALNILRRGIDGILFPPVCLGCGERIVDSETILCTHCLGSVDRAEPYEIDERLQRLPEARQAIDFAFSLWIFDKQGLLQEVHHALKYGNRPGYGRILGEVLGSALVEAYAARELPSLAIPIPLHRSRLYERGYNQSEMLAEGLSEATGIPISTSILTRKKPTRSQTRLSREKRWANLSGAFGVAEPGEVAGRVVLLVDDVLTTGSTAGVAAAELKRAGARAVDLSTLAMARR